MSELLELIKSRKSVRSFDGRPLAAADRERLAEYMSAVTNPFGIPVRFVLLDAAENGLSSPVITGETLYVAGIVARVPGAETAFGYAFEKLVLYAWQLGIGTTWIAGTMKRETFERAAGLREGEIMPCVSPLGYPASRRSLRETLMRKGVGADARKPVSELFYDREWGTPLPEEKLRPIADAAEMVRWAPSAVNRQPWRIIVRDGCCHFYEARSKGFSGEKTGDLQKIDTGIALCHFVEGLRELGNSPAVLVKDPGLSVPENAEYVTSVQF
ncbi:MAG: nitroreductase family protein [Clostridiales bacterium]|nr:nitroreductase family protein [Clostridiales bacterium]